MIKIDIWNLIFVFLHIVSLVAIANLYAYNARLRRWAKIKQREMDKLDKEEIRLLEQLREVLDGTLDNPGAKEGVERMEKALRGKDVQH